MTNQQQELRDARIKGEKARVLANIAVQTERPTGAFWLSFATNEDGFRGALIIHADDFLEAIMQANLRGLNPHGEAQGMEIPPEAAATIPEHWKYRLLNRADCEAFDAEMLAKVEAHD